MRSKGCSPAAPNDRPCDLAREALLAVAAEDRRELALVPLVHDVLRAEVAGGIHAHVERRVDRVREAALGPVDLHARDAEVEQDRVGLDAVAGELGEHDAKLAAQEARLDAGLALEALEVRPHRGIAVDRDEAALALRGRRRAARAWPPAPKVASTTVSPGCTARSSRTSSARTGTWSVLLRCKALGNKLHTPFDFFELLSPGVAIPDLHVVAHACDDDVAPRGRRAG